MDELLRLYPKTPARSDELAPFFLKIAGPIITVPIADLFKLSLHTAEIPHAWKAAAVRLLFKEGDRADPVIGPSLYCLVCQMCWRNLKISS